MDQGKPKSIFKLTPNGHRRLEDVFRASEKGHDVLRPNQTSSRRLEEDDWFTTSWRCWIYVVLKTSDLRCLEDIWFPTSWRRLVYVDLKTSDLRRLGDTWLMMSWRRLIYDILKTPDLQSFEEVRFTTSSRSLAYDVLKTYVKQRLSSNVVARSIQRWKKYFFLILYCLKYSQNFKCFCLIRYEIL